MHGVFKEFAGDRSVSTDAPFPRIPYRRSHAEIWFSDKPDLRIPLEIAEA